MHFNLRELPSDLQHRYTKLSQDYKTFTEDLRDYQLSTIPRYVSIPLWAEENDYVLDYTEMKELAEMARVQSIRQMKPIRQGASPIGLLNCYNSDILDYCFELLTDPDEDEVDL